MKLSHLLDSRRRGDRRAQEGDKTGKEEEKEKQGHHERRPGVRYMALRKIYLLGRVVLNWAEPSGNKIRVPPTTEKPDLLKFARIDSDEWRVVQGNFPGPVGQWYAPDDDNKPEVYLWTGVTAPGEISDEADQLAGDRLVAIPQYQHQVHDGVLPPYEWARFACLPTPVVVDESWSSLLAAQREKFRLLETQRYIASRIADLDTQVRAVMDAKLERNPNLHQRYCGAQMTGALHAAGLVDLRTRIQRALDAGELDSIEGYDWVYDLDKVFVLRERLSPLSLLFPPPSY